MRRPPSHSSAAESSFERTEGRWPVQGSVRAVGSPIAAPSAVFGITRVAQITGATLRALRHYEALGLLTPSRDERGERRFTSRDCDKAALIVLLRRHEVAIAEIAPLLDDRLPHRDRAQAVRCVLQAQAKNLRARLAELEDALAGLI